MELIQESTQEIVVESVEDEEKQEKRWYVEGITLQSEIKNRNGRIYPFPVLEKAVNHYIENYLNRKRAIGELDHPINNSTNITPDNVSHMFETIKTEGKNFRSRAKILNTPKGKIAQNLLEEGIKLGISSRGLGSVSESNGCKIVKEFQIITAGDLVIEPSGTDCWLDAIHEQKDWIYENGELINVDLSEEMDTYKKLVSEAKTQDIQAVLKDILTDYFKKLSL